MTLKFKHLIFLLLLSTCLFGQKENIIKARVFVSPFGGSFGLGYERLITPQSSVQLLFNAIGEGGGDAGTKTVTFIVPEFKYYFKEQTSQSFFGAAFLEIGKRTEKPAGESAQNDTFRRSEEKIIAIGIMIGKNFKLSEKFHLDLYIGPKLRLSKKTTERRVNGVRMSNEENISALGLRGGLNINYSF